MCSSSESIDEIDLHKLTIYGFTRDNKKQIPDSIIKLIIAYYPSRYLVYAIGEDRNGFFGVGCNKQTDKFEKLPSWTYFCDSPHFIYHGLYRFILKTKFNKIYCSGRNEYGELGLGLKDENVMIFKQMKTNFLNKKSLSSHTKKKHKHDMYNDNIKIISNGKEAYHTYLVTKKGKFYAFGNNSYGQFGNGKKSKSNVNAPKLMFNKMKHIFNQSHNSHVNIVQIECGESHTIFLSSNGKMYSCGNSMFGQCGIRTNDNNLDIITDSNRSQYKQRCILTPTLIQFDDNNIKIIDIKCGCFHNLCIDSDNILYVFGSNELGQCGMNHRTYINTPEQQNYLLQYKINKIECGSNHSMVISDNGNCYLFGDNEYGQIGVNHEKYKVITKPKLFQSIRVKTNCTQKQENISTSHSISHMSVYSGSQSIQPKHIINDENKSNNISSTINISTTISSTMPTTTISSTIPSSVSPSSKSMKSRTFEFNDNINNNNNNNNNVKIHRNKIFKNIKIHSGSLSDLHSVLLTYNNDIITFGSNHTHQCSHLKQSNSIQLPSILNKKEIGIDENLQIDYVIAAGSATLLICLPQSTS